MHKLSTTSRLASAAAVVFAAAALLVILSASSAGASTSRVGFGFNARDISGFPTGSVRLTGGGAFDPATGFAHAGGGFRCTIAVEQAPLAGCETGQGVRWDTVALLDVSPFKCNLSSAETLKFAHPGPDTAVLKADFYRAGDGNNESFTANMIVSAHDLDPDLAGMQNVWVQGVGCANGNVNFSA